MAQDPSSLYDIEVKTLAGEPYTLARYRGEVLLIVNTASKCGFTPQYAGLEALHQRLGEKGLRVLGFPCNQFGGQEPGTAADIESFCQLNYGVSFAMHEKIDVNGKKTHPLYEHLKSTQPGVLGTTTIKWNFTKFLVDREGNVVDRFAPNIEPAALEKDITALLG
ncbi:MAG: glutathione peroxidase [Myxococcota bacterium]